MRASSSKAVRNRLHLRVVDKLGLAGDVVSKRAVCGDVNVVLLAELKKLVLGQKRMTLNLVGGLGKLCQRPVPSRRHRRQLTGQTPVASAIPLMFLIVKLDTPMALT